MNEGGVELKVVEVAEAVGLAFEDLDLVVEPLERAGGDGVLEPGEHLKGVGFEGGSERGEVVQRRGLGTGDPGEEDAPCGIGAGLVPELT